MRLYFFTVLTFALVFATQAAAQPRSIPNAAIDIKGFKAEAEAAAQFRETRRVTEAEFVEMAKDPNTIVLDTRSSVAFALMHVAGAVHLNFSDFTKESLSKAIPSKSTRILIYCNNNFTNFPVAFPSKSAPMALNIPTFINLYSYGYRNVYELGPVVDPGNSLLTFAGKTVARAE